MTNNCNMYNGQDADNICYDILLNIKDLDYITWKLYDGSFKEVEYKVLTVEMVADYYEVSKDMIQRIIQRHKNDLKGCGSEILTGYYLETFKDYYSFYSSKKNNASSIRIFPFESVVLIGKLISSNVVADKVKKAITKISNTILIERLNTHQSNFLKKELQLRMCLESVFNGLYLVNTKIKCGKYIIDFVIDNRIAVECDEFGHRNRIQRYEKERQEYLESNGFKVFRFNPDNEDEYEVFRVINQVLRYLLNN